jgi:hypothetical protein
MDSKEMIRFKYVFLLLSRLNFNTFFYKADTGLPVLFSDIFPKKTYSLVANSSSLKEKKYGTAIDKNDYVIRFNNFEKNGYESHIGKKTNIWIISSGTNPPASLCTNIYISNKKTFKESQEYLKNIFSEKVLPYFFIFQNEYVQRILNNYLNKEPSIEFFILFLLSIKYKTIQTFGFDFCKNKEKEIYQFMENNKIITSHKKYYLQTFSNQKEMNEDTTKKLTTINQLLQKETF